MMAQYPEKFHTAKAFVKHLHKEGRELCDESQLVLYALDRQVQDGACKEPKPSAWNARERALWQAWDHLGQMSKEEAMRLYVKQLEIDVPKWWAHIPVEMGSESNSNSLGTSSSGGAASPCQINLLQATNASPKPRYEHGSLCVGSRVFVVGGRSGGRYLNDCWVLDLKSRTWSERKWHEVDQSNMTVLPALAAASYLHQGGLRCVVVGGHTKPDNRTDDMKVYRVDLGSMQVEKCSSFGDHIPSARGGHSSVLVRSQVYVFGGEETLSKKLMGDLHVYDLHSSTWTTTATKGTPPCARSAHSATVVKDKYVVIFGGGSVSRCFNDVHVLDTQSMEWFTPQIDSEDLPAPRAGHAHVLLGEDWYIVGGGNNTSACTDLYVLDLSCIDQGKARWTALGELSSDVHLSCEGASLVEANSSGNKAIAFGGYNGKYLDRLCELHRSNLRKMAADNGKRQPPVKEPQQEAPASTPTTPTALDAEASEVSALRKELSVTKEKLKQESKKCMALEVENAELKQRVQDLEDTYLGHNKTHSKGAPRENGGGNSNDNGGGEEAAIAAELPTSSGGLWGYLSGTG